MNTPWVLAPSTKYKLLEELISSALAKMRSDPIYPAPITSKLVIFHIALSSIFVSSSLAFDIDKSSCF